MCCGMSSRCGGECESSRSCTCTGNEYWSKQLSAVALTLCMGSWRHHGYHKCGPRGSTLECRVLELLVACGSMGGTRRTGVFRALFEWAAKWQEHGTDSRSAGCDF